MRISTVNASVAGGGAEQVARSLHEAYLERGHDAWFLVGNVNAECEHTIEIPNDRYRGPWARSLRRLARGSARRSGRDGDLWWYADRALRTVAEPARYARVARGHEDFDHPATRHLLELTPAVPDVLNLHNLHGSYFDIRALPELTRQVPTVLTMHDAWLITGHCAQPIECERWLTGCETCPNLDRYVPLMADASAENRRVKREAIARADLRIATPSRWLLDLVERSDIAEAIAEARVIPNGIDLGVFTPGDRAAERRALGLPPDALIVLFAARSGRDGDAKGFGVLERALPAIGARTGDRDIVVVAIGPGDDQRRAGEVPVRHVPSVESREAIATYYRAADLYVHPSRAESFGLTALESMACGTPVVASDVGAIPEVVNDGVTGLLVAPDSPEALASAIRAALSDDPLRARMAAAGIERARAFSLDRQVEAYLSWYRELVPGA